MSDVESLFSDVFDQPDTKGHNVESLFSDVFDQPQGSLDRPGVLAGVPEELEQAAKTGQVSPSQVFMQTPSDAEKEMDSMEDLTRPEGVMDFMVEMGKGAKKEVTALMSLFGQVVAHPIRTGKAISKTVEKIDKGDVPALLLSFLKDMGRTVGVDTDRPDGIWDVDTLINRWKDEPLSAVGDVMTVWGVGKNVIQKGANAGKKVAVHNAIRKNGDKMSKMMDDMIETVRPEIMDEKRKYIKTSEMVKNIDADFNTSFQELSKHAKTIKGDPKKGLKPLSISQLNSTDFMSKRSKRLASNIQKVAASERSLMNRALRKVEEVPVRKMDLKDRIFKNLDDVNLLDQTEDGLVIVDELNKPVMKKVLKALEEPDTLTVKRSKQLMDRLDDSINWKDPKQLDDGLKVVRRAVRETLGEISPEYDTIAKRISDRLDDFGLVEKRIKNDLAFTETVAEKIAGSDALITEMRNKMNNISVATGGKVAAADQILGNLDIIEAWVAWNKFFGTNPGYFPKGVKVGTFTPIPIPFTNTIQKKVVKQSLGTPSKIVGGMGRGAVKTAKGVGKAVKTGVKSSPIAATITEGLR